MSRIPGACKRPYSIVDQSDPFIKDAFPRREIPFPRGTKKAVLSKALSSSGLLASEDLQTFFRQEAKRRSSCIAMETSNENHVIAASIPQEDTKPPNIKLAKKSDNGNEMSYFQLLKRRAPKYQKRATMSKAMNALEAEIDRFRPRSSTPEPDVILMAAAGNNSIERGHSVVVSDERFVSATSYTPKYCYCMRCQMMYKMYKSGDKRLDMWGNYPCHKH